MDLIERINDSIEILKDPDGKIFDFDKEAELLFKIKDVLDKYFNDQNVIEDNNYQIKELNNTNSALENEKNELEKRFEESKVELEKFRNLLIREINGRMRLLKYPELEINKVLGLKKFSEIFEMREKILNEFDLKFNIKHTVKDTPKSELTNYSEYKI